MIAHKVFKSHAQKLKISYKKYEIFSFADRLG
jgi:hypothetical protein